jgi:copper-transporting P-type ATPase V
MGGVTSVSGLAGSAGMGGATSVSGLAGSAAVGGVAKVSGLAGSAAVGGARSVSGLAASAAVGGAGTVAGLAASAAVGGVATVPGLADPDGVGGVAVAVGRRTWMQDIGIAVAAEVAVAADRFEEGGATAVVVASDGVVRGVLAVADTLRPEAPAVVQRLQRSGIRVAMLTGDNRRTADAVAKAAGIDEVMAEVLPAGKLAEIARLKESGRRVAMVGDGVNDAPALVEADLGIAIGTGTGAAIEAADVTLLSSDLGGVPQALALARATYATIRQNLGWAFGYNLVAIPLAAVGLLNPSFAAAAMGLSSVSVVTNSLRLTRFRADSTRD